MDLSFSGGEEMQKKLAEIAEKLGNAKTLRVGFLENSTYQDGTSVPMVAAANEWGDPAMNRPPRPFFRNMIADCSPEWGEDLAKIAAATDFNSETLLPLMGERIKDQLQASIRQFSDPPLAPYTIKKKGFDKPLIESAVMLNAVDYDVKDGA